MLEDELVNLKSFKALNKLLPSAVLADSQIVGVLKALYRKRAIIMYDVGMGKTYMASAYIKMLLNQDSNTRFLFFMKKLQTQQTPKDIERLTGVAVKFLPDATKQTITALEYDSEFENYRVLILTHDFLQSESGMQFLYKHKDLFKAIIIDEAHNLNNNRSAQKSSMLKALCSRFEYRLALTATPIVTDVRQLTRLASTIDSDTYPDSERLARAMQANRFSIEQDPCFFIEKSRKDIGIHEEIIGDVLWVEPQRNQRYTSGRQMHNLCKGPGARNQAEALVKFILANKGTRGIVYVNEHKKREWLLPFLDEAGISYACLNGSTPDFERTEVQTTFNTTDDIQVILTSLTESLNLDCEWVLFYELTSNVQQTLGRAYRGLNDKKLYVYFMLTRDTDESQYFVNTVVKNAIKVRDNANKVYSAVFDAYEIIKEEGEIDEYAEDD